MEPRAASELPGSQRPYEPPRFELIALDCEITAYAPDGEGEEPLF